MNVITEGRLPMQTKISPNEHVKGEKVGLLKRHYQKPVLKTYGPVKHLTQGGTGSAAEGSSGMVGMM
jgi:uncharacterized protein YciI